MPDTVRARAKKRIGSLIRDLAHFVPHSGHTYAVASRTSSKFTAREHAVATDPATVQAAPLGSAHLLSPLSLCLSTLAQRFSRARRERERERLHPDAPFHLPAQYAFLLRGRRSLFDPYPFSFSYRRRAELLAGVTRLYSGGGEWRVARKKRMGDFRALVVPEEIRSFFNAFHCSRKENRVIFTFSLKRKRVTNIDFFSFLFYLGRKISRNLRSGAWISD